MLLLVVIYLAFIGLGIPDSLFGTAWPIIYREYGLPVSLAGAVTMFSCACSAVSSLMSSRVISRFGTARCAAVSTGLTAIGLLGYSLTQNVVMIFACCIPLGFGAGAIDAALNNYVALHFGASQMSFLHCCYGVGVTISPFIMSLTLKDGDWRGGYRAAFFIQAVITVAVFLSLPLWHEKRGRAKSDKKQSNEQAAETYETGATESNQSEAAADSTVETVADARAEGRAKPKKPRLHGLVYVCFVFMLACAIEVIVGGWGSTYLVDALGQNADDAALVVTFYYAGMALGRFVSGLLAQIWSSRRIIKVGCTIIAVAIVVLLLPLGDAAILTSSVAMFLIGFGNGPVYPNLVHMTPQSFGSANSQRAMGAQMASAYVGTMLFQPCFGLLAQLFGAGIFPLCIAVLFAMMIVFLALYLFSASKNKAI
ncbi:MAG TPA: MFS transporter [Firmicutes bacterium]|nr:MFS transporter [Bacillota bacterium]